MRFYENNKKQKRVYIYENMLVNKSGLRVNSPHSYC